MITQVTDGIKISVETSYQEEYSQPLNNEFMFTYRVVIENQSEYTIKVLRRHWFVFDSCGIVREVEGEGVVGQQPVIESGKVHEYVSGSHLKTEMGKMRGTYQVKQMPDGKEFTVVIPEFELIAPFKLN